MNVDASSTRSLQFTLRGVLFAMFVLGIVIVNWRLVLAFTSGFFWGTTFLVAYICYLVGGDARSRFRQSSVRTRRSRASCIVLVILIASSAVVLWARSRWFGWWYDSYWPPKSFPYPDAMLASFHDWIDTTFPATDGYLKIHGEFYSVLLVLNLVAWLVVSCLAFQLGMMFGAITGVEMWKWCRKMVPFPRRAT